MWQLDKWGGRVRPKSPTSRRTVPLRAEVVEALDVARPAGHLGRPARRRVGQRARSRVHDRTGGPVWTRNVSRVFTKAQQTARVNHGSLKTLRSTVVTQLAEAGAHPRKAQAFLGHADMTTTMKYHTAVDDLDDIADHLPNLARAWPVLKLI